MATLKELAQQILAEKNNKVLPTKIEKDWEVFDVIGTLKSGGDVKLFSTVEEMQADPNPHEGDLAVVYDNEYLTNWDGSAATMLHLPEIVTLPEQITSSMYGYLDTNRRNQITLNASTCRLRIYTSRTASTTYTYTSTDGTHYTRSGDITEITSYYEFNASNPTSDWDDIFGYFLQSVGNGFFGLYKYTLNNPITNTFQLFKLDSSVYDWTNTTQGTAPNITTKYDTFALYNREYCTQELGSKIVNICDTTDINITDVINIFLNTDKTKLICIANSGSVIYWNNKFYLKSIYSSATTNNIYEISLDTGEYTISTASFTAVTLPADNTSGTTSYVWEIPSDYYYYLGKTRLKNLTSHANNLSVLMYYISSTSYSLNWYFYDDTTVNHRDEYITAPTQLDATADYVYGKTFYGKNGVETGILGDTILNTFNDNVAAIYTKAQSAYNNMTPLVASDSNKRAGLGTDIVIIPEKSNGTSLLDTSNVTTMETMFYGCANLKFISLLDTSNVTNMSQMFYNCKNLAIVPLFNTSNVTNMYQMFRYCTTLTTVPLFDTSNVTTMEGMFNDCTNLVTIPLFDTSNVTTMNSMFGSCTNLTNVPLFNTSNVTTMSYTFSRCPNLTAIPLFDTSNVTIMGGTFSYCYGLTEIPQFDTSKVTNVYEMFGGCTNLTTIPLLDTSNVTRVYNMLAGCTSLSNDSLNNILAMCANATNAEEKILKYLFGNNDMSSFYPASTIQGLPNYSAFTAAGWTIGW